MKLTCAIIDDEPLARELIKSYVLKTTLLQLVGCYSSAIEALQNRSHEKPVQLLFLDIQMPELDGLAYSKMVSAETRIIFTTAFNQYALDSYKVHALDYLLKPISYTDFLSSVNKAVQWFELKEGIQREAIPQDNHSACIYVKSDYKLIQVALNEILYIEGLKDYVKIYLEHREKPILSLMSMKSLEERLPTHQFIRVHRSFIVQRHKIKVVDRGRIVFGKEYIPVSDSYKNELMLYLNEHSI
ncbi:MAG: LytR/AlgR family response regulator transcription factor [Phocaeicola sp.]